MIYARIHSTLGFIYKAHILKLRARTHTHTLYYMIYARIHSSLGFIYKAHILERVLYTAMMTQNAFSGTDV